MLHLQGCLDTLLLILLDASFKASDIFPLSRSKPLLSLTALVPRCGNANLSDSVSKSECDPSRSGGSTFRGILINFSIRNSSVARCLGKHASPFPSQLHSGLEIPAAPVGEVLLLIVSSTRLPHLCLKVARESRRREGGKRKLGCRVFSIESTKGRDLRLVEQPLKCHQ